MVTARTTRREFIQGTGVLIVGFGLAEPMRAALGQPAPAGKTVATDEVDAFVSIARDGGVSVFTGKVDLGTGIRVALRQMAAEELDVPVDRISLVEGDTALTPDQGPTWGSLSVQVGGVQIRQAAATARKALVDLAAARLGVSSGELEVKFGIVRVRADMTKSASYAELIGDQEFHLKLDKNAPLKKAAERLKPSWSAWEGLPEMDKLYQVVRATPVAKDEITVNVGDPKSALASAAKTLAATYEFAIHTHGSIGPSCAVADVRDGSATIWSASQAPHWLRRELSAMLGIPVALIRVHYLDGAGCYGRNGHEDAAADAALLSREVGRPVRVQWMRHDEHGWDPKGPPTLVELKGGLDAGGSIVAWQSEFWIPKLSAITDGVPLIAATLAGLPRKEAINPGNIFQNSAPSYPFPNAHALVHRLETTPFRPSWIRTPGRMQNTYANEAFMDELAAAAGADPVEFRLRHLKDPRGVEVLKAAATAAKWETRASPRKAAAKAAIAAGRGVTYVKYENVRTYVAAVAEVVVERRSGAIRVMRVVVAHDCGLVIHPDGVRAAIEGNVIQTVSRTVKEELKWDRSRVTSVDWKSYPILTFPEVPEVVSVLINRPDQPPWGAGEPAAAVVPSAISNAVFDAIGVRLRTIPYTPERVRAAILAET